MISRVAAVLIKTVSVQIRLDPCYLTKHNYQAGLHIIPGDFVKAELDV